MAGLLPVGTGDAYGGTDWKGRRMGTFGLRGVVPGRHSGTDSFRGNVPVWGGRFIVKEERTAICPFSDDGRSGGTMDKKMKQYKRKGRFVLEAAILVPGICLILVSLVYFTLYAHDYAVCAHAALESGTKGIYREGDSHAEMEQKIRQDLKEKLEHRLLWVKAPEIQVQVNPAQAVIQISGQGDFLQGCHVKVTRKISRIRPCTTIRKYRWLTGRMKL